MLWINLLLLATAAVSLGFAHAIIPSAVATGTFPQSANKARPVLYFIGIGAIVAAIAVFIIAGNLAYDVLSDFYPRWYQ
ncbi:MAG: hypothetical protein ACOC5M_01305 [Chloroflexota bacterium]